MCQYSHFLLLLSTIFVPTTHQSSPLECSQKKFIPVKKIFELGQLSAGDSGSTSTFPCWLDVKLARIGQNFAQKYFGHMFFAHALSLVALLSDEQTRRVLVLTGKSDTPDKSARRYLATAQQIHLWYHSDILSPQWTQSVEKVREIHSFVAFYVDTLNDTYANIKVAEEKRSGFKPNEKMWEAFNLDIKNFDREKILSQSVHFNISLPKPKFKFNQYTMTLTIWAFMALPILSPTQLGISKYSERDLQGFAHLWATVGYALGTEERFIFCKTPDEWPECKLFLKGLFQTHFLPQLLDLNFEGETMIESLLWGMEKLVPRYPPDALLINLLEKHLGIRAKNLRRQRSLQSSVLGSSANWFMNAATLRSGLLRSFFTSLAFGEMQLA
ncbi:unnamed protein product, partial [Allacma fusca]